MAQDVAKFRPSSESNKLAEQVATEELRKTQNYDTLRKSYLNLMHQLEIDGIPREKISTVGQKIVVEKKRSIKKSEGATPEEIKKINIGSWWYDVAKEENYIDPKFSHPDAPDPERKIVPQTEIEIENSDYIRLVRDTIEFLKDIALPKLRTNHFMSLLDDDKKVLLALHDWEAQLDIAKSFFNHKEKIPPYTQLILYYNIGTYSSNNDAAEGYFNQRKEFHEITGKQISKYRSGEIKPSLTIFKPKDRISASMWKYAGEKCPKCESWEVDDIKSGKGRCLICDNVFELLAVAKCNFCSFPFFEEEIGYIKQKGNTCPNCKEELPEYLINYITN